MEAKNTLPGHRRTITIPAPPAHDEPDDSAPPTRPTPTIRQRHRARMIAFQTLYESDVTGHDPSTVLSRLYEGLHPQPEVLEYARTLVQGVLDHRADIDGRIRQHATALPFAQMAVVDRALLRLGLFEALHNSSTIPVGVAIDEAVELAKLYGAESSSRFINGVLGRIAAEMGQSRGSSAQEQAQGG
jgi:transcription antitermination protein NusB